MNLWIVWYHAGVKIELCVAVSAGNSNAGLPVLALGGRLHGRFVGIECEGDSHTIRHT